MALSYPAPALIINGRQDAMYPFRAQEIARRETLRLCRRQSRSPRVAWHYFDGPHCFHPPEQQLALEFFQRHLNP